MQKLLRIIRAPSGLSESSVVMHSLVPMPSTQPPGCSTPAPSAAHT